MTKQIRQAELEKATLDDFVNFAEISKITRSSLKLTDQKARLLDYKDAPEGEGVWGGLYLIKPRGWVSKDKNYAVNLMKHIEHADTPMLESPAIRILSATAKTYRWKTYCDEDDAAPFSIDFQISRGGPRSYYTARHPSDGSLFSVGSVPYFDTCMMYDPFDGSIRISGNRMDEQSLAFYRDIGKLARNAKFKMFILLEKQAKA